MIHLHRLGGLLEIASAWPASEIECGRENDVWDPLDGSVFGDDDGMASDGCRGTGDRTLRTRGGRVAVNVPGGVESREGSEDPHDRTNVDKGAQNERSN